MCSQSTGVASQQIDEGPFVAISTLILAISISTATARWCFRRHARSVEANDTTDEAIEGLGPSAAIEAETVEAARVADLQTKSNAGPESEDERDTSTKGDHKWSARILSACTLSILCPISLNAVVFPMFEYYLPISMTFSYLSSLDIHDTFVDKY